MYVLWVCIYIIYIIYMRDLVIFDTGLVQVNFLLSQMRHIPSQQLESRAFSTFYDFPSVQCLSHAAQSLLCQIQNSLQSQQYFICRQSVLLYKLLLTNDYNSESITLIKRNPEHHGEVLFCSWKSVEQQQYVVMLVSKYLTC